MQHKPLQIVSTPSSTKRNNRRTANQWRDLMKTYENSGLNQAAFCQQQGIALSTFYSWRKKLRARTESADNPSQQNPFIELSPPMLDASTNDGWDVELAFANGMTLRLRAASC